MRRRLDGGKAPVGQGMGESAGSVEMDGGCLCTMINRDFSVMVTICERHKLNEYPSFFNGG